MDYQQLKTVYQVFLRHLKPALRSPGEAIQLIKKVFSTVSSGGLPKLLRRYSVPKNFQREYARWVALYDSATFGQERLNFQPLFSILIVVDSPHGYNSLVSSLRRQTYPDWQLLISCHASLASSEQPQLLSRHDQIRWFQADKDTSLASRFDQLLTESAGEWIIILAPSTILSDHALYFYAAEINKYPAAEIIYSDEDKIDKKGQRYQPHFKPDWNPVLLLSQNYMGKAVAYRKARLQATRGLHNILEQMFEWDLALRMTAFCKAEHIRHIPRVLSHGDALSEPKLNETDMARLSKDVLAAHFQRLERKASFVDLAKGRLRIKYELPSPVPLISIIIPTRDNTTFLAKCVQSIREKTTYPSYEIIIVDNQSRDAKTLQYLGELEARGELRVLRYEAPFNYSAINNFAVAHAKGELLALVNDDIEVISPDWLEEMAGYAIQPETGAVGAMLFYPNDTIQHAGTILGLHGVAGHVFPGQPRGYPGDYERCLTAQNLTAVTAACMVLRRVIYEEAGGLDEALPIACNDVDLCLRLVQKGYQNVWTPHAELYHHESVSRGYDDTQARQERAAVETAMMWQRWEGRLLEDPAYNPNFSLESDFALAFPPRRYSERES